MHRLNSNIEKLLKKLAALLPPVNVHATEIHMLTGAEILAWGTVTELDGQPIMPHKMYKYRYPVITRASHYRRLKKAFKNNGIAGVQNYLQFVTTLSKSKAIENQMKAIQMLIKNMQPQR